MTSNVSSGLAKQSNLISNIARKIKLGLYRLLLKTFLSFFLGLLNASAQERNDAAERQKNLSIILSEIARDERDAKRLIWSNKLTQSRAALQAENLRKEVEMFRKEEAQAARDKMRLERDLAQKRLDSAP
jgi:hypothetical protein